MENIAAIIEALILASETPLGLDKIYSVLEGTDKAQIREALNNLIAAYEQRAAGVTIGEVAGGYQFRTRPEMSVWVKKLKGSKPPTLSAAALETLAIVAYRQPIIKSEIEGVRGVDSGAALKSLLEKKLVRIIGRKDVPGRPIIYGTTKKFLEVFNLRELTDLPSMRELKEITEQQGVLELEEAEIRMSVNENTIEDHIFENTSASANQTGKEDQFTDESEATADEPAFEDTPEEAPEPVEISQELEPEDETPIVSSPQNISGESPDVQEADHGLKGGEAADTAPVLRERPGDDIDL